MSAARSLRLAAALALGACGPSEIVVGRDLLSQAGSAGAGAVAGAGGLSGASGGVTGGMSGASGGGAGGMSGSTGGSAGGLSGASGGGAGGLSGASGGGGQAGAGEGGQPGGGGAGEAGAAGAAGAALCGAPGQEAPCGPAEFCDHADKACNREGGGGVCKPRPALEVCPQACNPICACDGVVYCNECHANHAGTDADPQGACP